MFTLLADNRIVNCIVRGAPLLALVVADTHHPVGIPAAPQPLDDEDTHTFVNSKATIHRVCVRVCCGSCPESLNGSKHMPLASLGAAVNSRLLPPLIFMCLLFISVSRAV